MNDEKAPLVDEDGADDAMTKLQTRNSRMLHTQENPLKGLTIDKRFSVHERFAAKPIPQDLLSRVTGHSRKATKDQTADLDRIAEQALAETQPGADGTNGLAFTEGPTKDAAGKVAFKSKSQNVEFVYEPIVNPEFTLSYKNASFSVEDRVIVKPISGYFCNGELVALMGPSGSGKTTLLTMVAGKKTTAYSGEFKINGNERDLNLLPRISGYCPQQEILYPSMTVREAFIFYTLLKVDCTEEEAEERAEQLLVALQLEHTAGTMIGDNRRRGISGGQKRRVHIGKALTNKPNILFLDEPTSGLSSTDSLTVGRILRHLADTEDTLIVCVIHQPRISLFELFDHLVLLSSEGKTMYNGAVSQAVEYFHHLGRPLPMGENPADFFMDVVTRGSELDSAEQFGEFYTTHVAPEIEKQSEALPSGKSIPEIIGLSAEEEKQQGRNIRYNRSSWFQFKILAKMNLVLRLRQWPDMIRKAVMYIVIGLLFGLIFFQASQEITNKALPELQPIYILVSLWATMAFAGIFTMESLPKIIEERIIYKYDRMDGIYATFPYFCAMSVIFLLENVIDVILMGIVAYWMIGYNNDMVGPFFYYLAVLGMAYWVTEGLMMILAGLSKDVEMANGITVAILGFLLVFSGMLVNSAQTVAWVAWVVWISPFWYGFEALAVNWARYYTWDAGSSLTSAEDLYAAFGLNPARQYWDILIMFGFAIFYRAIALVALRYANNPQI
ncbi:ABC transporter G family member 22 [Porphyridium purpureum]|uniref:Probable ATP-dependent transporter ycf16 n=1 Tax=Porphyridium purpureum TaxID=35688 RepID=A0A5J4YN08_PORPP|nr:ABC transporter G family member 22 [Porphyridium purpureum]|eukprot:POR8130..scf295_9